MNSWQAYALVYGAPAVGLVLVYVAYRYEKREAREREEELEMLERLWNEDS